MRVLFPSRSIALLMLIGFTDLVMTAWLHAAGMISELNPLMKPLIERNELLFVAVKGMTLVLAWFVMAHYCKTNREFVRKAAILASIAYVTIWTAWVITAHI
ncbi:MAG: hypothetical protein KF784_07345 [Fimbriimonadaceae bacterium]|nr:hypothetical protein [Fimbriimonadaceae bacterium]